jgi:hypothetical protein
VTANTRRTAIILYLLALVWFTPGIWWGLPHATAANRAYPWGSDELAPLGAVGELHRVFLERNPTFNYQYPLFHYMVQAVTVVPYITAVYASGDLRNPSGTYPFGFDDPVHALAVTTILARIVSLLMAAGVVLAAWQTATILWNRRAGLIAALLVLLMYPMAYYARTSNVDMGGVFWTSLGIVVFTQAIQNSLTVRRAIWLGTFAALATATKDASYAAFAMLALVLVPHHLLKARRANENWAQAVKPLAVGLVSSSAVYVVASGLLFDPGRWMGHVRWVTNTEAAFLYPSTFTGFSSLVRETIGHVVASMGIPAALATVAGLILAVRRSPLSLSLALPALGIFVGTIQPIRFVNFRYVLIMAYVLIFFGAYAFSMGLQSTDRTLRRVTVAALAITLSWSALRGADLTYQMINDSRYALGDVMRTTVRAGDRVGYYGAAQKLPPLPAGVITEPAEYICTPADWASNDAPDFVVIIPQQHFEEDHEFTLSPTVYRGLIDGSLGYRRLAYLHTRSLFSRRPVPFVNPPVQLFGRDQRGVAGAEQGVADQPRPAVFAPIERALGLLPRKPPGLIRNPTPPRSPDICP